MFDLKSLVVFLSIVSCVSIGTVIFLVGKNSAQAPSEPVQLADNNSEQVPGELIKDVDERAVAFNAINEILAHPDDPQNPIGVVGQTDEQIAELAFEDIQQLIETALPYAEEAVDEPRYLFALGRAAWLHEDDPEFALELLGQASSLGSAAADAYIARIVDDPDETVNYLNEAIAGGFEPARELLKAFEIDLKLASLAKFDASKFNRPDLIQAFYDDTTSQLQENEHYLLTYVFSFHSVFDNTSDLLFMVEDTSIITEIDPKFSYMANQKLMGSRSALRQGKRDELKSKFGPLIKGLKARKSGGSLRDSFYEAKAATADTPTAKLQVLRNQGAQDAKRLVLMFDTNPEAFRKVYEGLTKFISKF